MAEAKKREKSSAKDGAKSAAKGSAESGTGDAPNAKGKTTAAESVEGEEHVFQADMQQLLHIIVHSLYSEREIFIRELISNAADALNRVRFLMLTDSNVRDAKQELEITLDIDTDNKAITIHDTGIGMTRDELVSSLGTIARSGTLDFVKRLSATEPGQRMEMIGQFGVGFYSVFMVSARVVVDTCPADPDQAPTRWVSDGGGSYSLLSSDKKQRGTSVRIELRDDSEEFAKGFRIEEVVKRYSSFIPHPIRMDGRQLNTLDAIWSLPKDQVTSERYAEFYKFIAHQMEDPLHTIHLTIDAPVQYSALLFIPKHLTNEMLYSRTGFGLKLYANKVFIQDDCQELLPIHMRFLRGVVDSEDLPLNVSREMVQQNQLLTRIRKSLTGRVLRELKSLSEDNPEKYTTFWAEYGKVLKEGITSDEANKQRLLELARYNSSIGENAEDMTTLNDYVSRMREGQKEILYYSGPSREAIERNPNLEYFRRQGLEVLYFYDQVDDFVMAQLREFDGKPFARIDQADLDALKEGDAIESEHEALEDDAMAKLMEYVKERLGERITAVVPSKRLVDSPAVLVSPDGDSVNLEKMMRLLNEKFSPSAKILEINPNHPLVSNLSRMLQSGGDDPLLGEITEQLFENCLLVEGMLEKPEKMVARIQTLMERAAALQVQTLPSSS
ncbi:MAG: molecular chaperone HtpG [SAR324 cluster bacterium]|nr:molecular chaperone HtpG [SAR324 cluster bacterium]